MHQNADEYFSVPILGYRMHPQYNEDTMSHDFCLVSVPNLIDNASPQAVFEPACLPGNDFSNFLTIREALTLPRQGDDFALRAKVHHIWCIL